MLAASAVTCLGQAAEIPPRCQVSYPPAANGKAAESIAVSINAPSMLVAVVTPGADATHPSVSMGNRTVPARMIGYDPVSSLSFLNCEGRASQTPLQWRDNADGLVNTPLQALAPGGVVKCRATGWIKQVGSKILPLALLQVTFDQAVPPPGTPLLDPQGRVAAILFQAAANGNSGYAIPAEAVHRVKRDLSNGGSLVRGYLGLSLRAETKTPKVVKVLPNSPAAAAGILPGDVLLKVGTRGITDYADAANAFFYLIPGQPLRVKLQRGASQFEYTLTPTRSPAR